MENREIERIKLEKLKLIIPNILYNKLEALEIDDIKGVIDLNLLDFSKMKGVGKKAVSQLAKFQSVIANNPKELLENYEHAISNNLKIEKESELGKIPLEHISELIGSKLINKFHANGVKDIFQLSNVSRLEFSKWPSVGKSTITLFNDLILKLKEEPNVFLTAYKNKVIPKKLPIKDSDHLIDLDYFEEFKRIVNDYLSLLINKQERERDILIKRYGLFNNGQYNTVEIGLYYELSNERIRQLIVKHLNNFRILFEGKPLTDPFCIVSSKNIDNLNLISNHVRSFTIISYDNLVKSFQKNFSLSSLHQNPGYLSLFLDILGIEVSAESNIPYSNTEYYFISPKIDKGSFYETSKYCYDYLRDTVIPVKEFDLIISLKKQYKNASKEYIKLALNQMPEIEGIVKNKGEKIYQIRFDKLKSGPDQAERVLFEKNRSMNLDEIVSEINHRLFNLGENKTISRKSLGSVIRHNKNIVPKGKTGYYSLVNWDENSESIYDVIYKSFLHHQKPLTTVEIIKYVKSIRPNLKDNSIRTVTNDRFLPIKGRKYIIPSWEHKYKDLIITKGKRKANASTIKEQMRQILLQEPQKKLTQKEFGKKIREKLKIGYPTFYASIKDSNLFIVSKEDNIKIITAVENPKVLKSDKKKESLKIIYQILEKNNGSCLLSIVIKELAKKDVPKGSAYRFIDNDLNLEKYYNENGKVILSKKRNFPPASELNKNWEKIKKKIEREVKDIFDDSRQPQYRITFSEALDLFYKLIVKSTSESGLNGLEERLLPTLDKYFNNNDRNDRLNFLTQITTSLDPFLKKVLLFADNTKYLEFKRKPKGHQGLGKLIDILDRLDSRLNRYRPEERSASLIPFGKQMFVAYSNRNIEAHEAENWAEKDIVKIITSCLVIYIFTIFEYHNELNLRL